MNLQEALSILENYVPCAHLVLQVGSEKEDRYRCDFCKKYMDEFQLEYDEKKTDEFEVAINLIRIVIKG